MLPNKHQAARMYNNVYRALVTNSYNCTSMIHTSIYNLYRQIRQRVKGRTKAYKGNGGRDPLILNFGTRW